MQYEDSAGCLWTEHDGEDGYVYYFNTQTKESAWELPPSAREILGAPADTTPTDLVPWQDDSSSWTQVLDESTNTTYFFNTSTQDSSWDLSTDDRLASGIYTEESLTEEELYASHCQDDSSYSTWKTQVLDDFIVPQTVSESVGRAGSAHVWPLTLAGRPSRLERWDVLKAADPYREHFATGEAWRRERPEFDPKLSFYAFSSAVEHVERYWVEESEAPFRCRLQRNGLKFSRDIAKWEKRAPVRKTKSAPAAGEAAEWDRPEKVANEDNQGGSESGSENGSGRGSEGGEGGDGAGFFAFPLVVHNSHAHHVDWTSGPDRYQVTQETEPDWGWTRLFSFFAYAASKYHVLETTESPLAQKVMKGQFLTPERGWKCVLAFFAFDDNIPGSNRYYVEENDQPHKRTRVGMEPSCRWEARHDFAAFDIPVPGSCALDVHYTIRSTDSLNPYPEQCRISLKDPYGQWEQKFRFYAFPAEHVLLSPIQEELDAQSASLEGGSSLSSGIS